TERDRTSESPSLERQKATKLAGSLAGRACSVLESKVAV
ncbi:hypothetical protein A2U01_0109044, partial [Trifolium medium]|nr:hypothetical protein [Trifolium medium]